MVLTPVSVVDYLLERGYIAAAAVVDGDFAVTDLSHRNRTFRIDGWDPGYLVKQTRRTEPEQLATLEREAAFYRMAANDPAFAPLAPFLPKCYAFDADHHVLVVELLEGEPLDRYHRRAGAFPTAMARLLGEALGAFHRTLRGPFRDNPPAAFPGEIPWALAAHEKTNDCFDAISQANSELLGILRRYPAFGRALRGLQRCWRRDTLIHGDMRWAHCLLRNGASGEPRLQIVDWEFADCGDPCWDAAGIVNEYLGCWIRSLPARPGVSPEDVVKLARYPLEEIQPAIRTFWRAYVDQAEIEPAAEEELLERTACYSAARMILFAFEIMQEASKLTARGVRLLQVSVNILTRPREAVACLLGL